MFANGKKILILGVGNILLSDEGFGPRAIYYLKDNYIWPDNVSLVDGGTRGLMLMAELMECELAIILDIVLGGGEKGTMYFLQDDDLGKNFSARQSMHQTGINDILTSCDLAGYRPKTMVFGFEPFDWQSLNPELSKGAKERLPLFCEKVVKKLVELGVRVEVACP